MKTYHGYRLGDPQSLDGVVVTVDGRPLSPTVSQKLRNHSPDGFEWGYGGSGPAQLALAILIDCYGLNSPEVSRYQDFKEKVVAALPHNDWTLTTDQIDAVMRAIQGVVPA